MSTPFQKKKNGKLLEKLHEILVAAKKKISLFPVSICSAWHL